MSMETVQFLFLEVKASKEIYAIVSLINVFYF